jgi:hypothetical protein
MVTKKNIELSVGDYLVDEFGTEIEIFSITILEGEFTVYEVLKIMIYILQMVY